MSLRSPRRLLIAGAAGFIGSNFVRLLRSTDPDVEITVLDKLTYAGNPANLAEFEGQPGYRFVHGDICDAALVNSLASEVDAIVNFAAETHVDRSLMDPFAFIETDVRGTAVLCEAARKFQHEVFVLISTDEVYGEVMEGRSKEGDSFRPRSPYSASKAGSEHIANAYAASFGLPLLVTRGSNTYGPYQYPEKAHPRPDHQRHRRYSAATVWGGRGSEGLPSRRGPLPRDQPGPARGTAVRRRLQHRHGP